MNLNAMLPQFMNMLNKEQPTRQNTNNVAQNKSPQNMGTSYPDTYLDSDKPIKVEHYEQTAKTQQTTDNSVNNNGNNMLNMLLPLLAGGGNADTASLLSSLGGGDNPMMSMLASAMSQNSNSSEKKNSPILSEFVDVDDYCFD